MPLGARAEVPNFSGGFVRDADQGDVNLEARAARRR